ncbi:hypothetical protein BN871_GH_00120 [Paenibacillus sp. P22]|nr:hypothetical protein BN871_GH_00120 [Paenibacillus sp. P22]
MAPCSAWSRAVLAPGEPVSDEFACLDAYPAFLGHPVDLQQLEPAESLDGHDISFAKLLRRILLALPVDPAAPGPDRLDDLRPADPIDVAADAVQPHGRDREAHLFHPADDRAQLRQRLDRRQHAELVDLAEMHVQEAGDLVRDKQLGSIRTDMDVSDAVALDSEPQDGSQVVAVIQLQMAAGYSLHFKDGYARILALQITIRGSNQRPPALRSLVSSIQSNADVGLPIRERHQNRCLPGIEEIRPLQLVKLGRASDPLQGAVDERPLLRMKMLIKAVCHWAALGEEEAQHADDALRDKAQSDQGDDRADVQHAADRRDEAAEDAEIRLDDLAEELADEALAGVGQP